MASLPAFHRRIDRFHQTHLPLVSHFAEEFGAHFTASIKPSNTISVMGPTRFRLRIQPFLR